MRGLLFFCLSTLFLSQSSMGFADELWYGVMDVGVREFRFVVSTNAGANRKDDVKWQLRSIDEGDSVFDLSNVQGTESTFSFELGKTRAAFQGTKSADGAEIDGLWKQSGAEFPLKLQKVNAVPKDAPDEIWTGELSTLFQKLKVQFRVYRKEDESDRILFDSVTQKVGGLVGTRVIDGKKWDVQIPGVGGAFEGTLSADGASVTGKWSQGGAQLDLELTKSEVVTATAAAPNRPQTPKPPFPYGSEDIKFDSMEEGVTLAGTLTIPAGMPPDGGFPAAVLISGSGPQDRDETIMDHKPFAVLADSLTRDGIAVLRFDDRGTAASTGDFSKATSQDFAADVRGAVRYLRTVNRVDAEKIGLIGHSEGGLIAPMVAVDDHDDAEDVAWIVLLAGPAVNGAEILKSQGALIMKAAGVTDEATLATQKTTQEVLMEVLQESPAGAPLETMVESAMKKLSDEQPSDEAARKVFRESIQAGMQTLDSPWFRYFLAYEPRPTLTKVPCPVLAINGERDVQVDAKLNLPVISAALKEAGNPLSEVEELPGLNHLFQTCTTGSVSEYQTIEETMSPVVFDRLKKWIHKVTATKN